MKKPNKQIKIVRFRSLGRRKAASLIYVVQCLLMAQTV